MKILDILHPDAILPDLKSQDKKGIIEELVAPLAQITGMDHKDLCRVLIEREQLGSTGIGEGIGIPHGKTKGIDTMVIAFGLSKKGVDFDSIDGKPTHIFFTLITPDQSTGLHLKLLARISKLLKSDGFKAKLMDAPSADEIHTIIKNEDVDF
ncbi:MAG: PTS sugar transporter subunit IIA [Proteobacteria bacterium]|nr:PTS sugar transporter subunit IIA [Pseudomonadota bacterium]